MGYLRDKTCDPFRQEKALLMRCMLKHVPRWGWSKAALLRLHHDRHSSTKSRTLLAPRLKAQPYAARDLLSNGKA